MNNALFCCYENKEPFIPLLLKGTMLLEFILKHFNSDHVIDFCVGKVCMVLSVTNTALVIKKSQIYEMSVGM